MFKLKLKELRKAAGMNQEELAEQIGVTRGKLGSWEREEINLPLDKACDICQVLGCTLEQLAGWEPKKPDKVEYFSVKLVNGKPEIVQD